jgi:hypothetical protein
MRVPSRDTALTPVNLLERAALAALSRGQFLRRTAIVVGGLVGLDLVRAAPALAAGSDPKPIPGGFSADFVPVPKDPFIHVLPPGVGFEMSTITDFKGHVGAAEIQGTASGSDGTKYDFDADMRFMRGLYEGLDGRLRRSSFAFI